jgi:hypothetical protein
MKLLRYTIPAHLPGYNSLGFPIYPGTFLLELPLLLSLYRKKVAAHAQEIIDHKRGIAYIQQSSSKPIDDSGFYQSQRHQAKSLVWLEEQDMTDDEIIEWDQSSPDLLSVPSARGSIHQQRVWLRNG